MKNIVAIDVDGDTFPDYFSVDRNSNQRIDAAVKIKISPLNAFSYQWFLDENEDGTPDKIADDLNGDWIIDQIYPI